MRGTLRPMSTQILWERPLIAFFDYPDVFEDFYLHYGVDQYTFATRWADSGSHAFLSMLQREVGDVIWYTFSLKPKLSEARHEVGWVPGEVPTVVLVASLLMACVLPATGWLGGGAEHTVPMQQWPPTSRRPRYLSSRRCGKTDLISSLCRATPADASTSCSCWPALGVPLIAWHAGGQPGDIWEAGSGNGRSPIPIVLSLPVGASVKCWRVDIEFPPNA